MGITGNIGGLSINVKYHPKRCKAMPVLTIYNIISFKLLKMYINLLQSQQVTDKLTECIESVILSY